jgi:metal-responsive CopG/Arc/MetJ family transcriptional regulator
VIILQKRTVQFSLRAPEALVKELDREAKYLGRTRSDVILMLAEEALEARKAKKEEKHESHGYVQDSQKP